MSRKFEAIDLMKLKALGSANGWNEFLNECLQNMDVNRLAKVRYQIQAGMDDLAKSHLNTEEMALWYIRLNRSIENTAKKIIRKKHPLPHDDGLISKSFADTKHIKDKRDFELAAFLKRSGY